MGRLVSKLAMIGAGTAKAAFCSLLTHRGLSAAVGPAHEWKKIAISSVGCF